MEHLTKTVKIGGLIVIALLLLVIYSVGVMNKSDEGLFKGVSVGSECRALQLGASATTSLIQTGNTTLCGVCITEDSPVSIVLWEATSTAAITQPQAKRVADFQAASVEGCYEFNAFLKNGLVFQKEDQSTAFGGDWSLMFR